MRWKDEDIGFHDSIQIAGQQQKCPILGVVLWETKIKFVICEQTIVVRRRHLSIPFGSVLDDQSITEPGCRIFSIYRLSSSIERSQLER